MDTAINNYSADYASNKFYENKYRQHYKLLEAKFPVNILTLDFDSSVLKAAEIDSMLDVWFSPKYPFLDDPHNCEDNDIGVEIRYSQNLKKFLYRGDYDPENYDKVAFKTLTVSFFLKKNKQYYNEQKQH